MIIIRNLNLLYLFLIILVSLLSFNSRESNTGFNSIVRLNQTYDNNVNTTIDLSDNYALDEPVLLDENGLQPINRSPIYPNDESDSFSNAETINYNEAYDRMYNEYYDYDYFTISISDDGLYSFYIDIQSTLIIYEYYPISGAANSNWNTKQIMTYNSIDSSDVIFLMGNYVYYLVVRPNVLYAGLYCFELTYITNNFTNYFMKTNYNNGALNNIEVIYRDFSNQSDSGLRYGYVPATCNIDIHDVERASNQDREYFQHYGDDHIYDVNNNITFNYEDDDRYITRTSDYPEMCRLST